MSKPTVIELFSGAGLLSHAFQRSGFKVVRAIEIDPVAAQTYKMNVGDHVEVADVSAVKPSGRCTVLLAGPPCQGYSTLGKCDPADPRNSLSLRILDWALATKPRAIVVENVPAFLNSGTWSRLTRSLERAGYQISSCVLNAADYGVAQFRNRSFTIAAFDGSDTITFPRKRQLVTVRDVIADLPPIPDGRNHHFSPTPSSLALARFRVIPRNGDKRDVMKKAPQLAAPSWWNVSSEVTDVWGRMSWDAPSNTLRTCLYNPSKGRYIHPDADRVISLREAARIHSIPDSWKFSGLHTQIARQIGNSVPPKLGDVVAKAVLRLVG